MHACNVTGHIGIDDPPEQDAPIRISFVVNRYAFVPGTGHNRFKFRHVDDCFDFIVVRSVSSATHRCNKIFVGVMKCFHQCTTQIIKHIPEENKDDNKKKSELCQWLPIVDTGLTVGSNVL